MRTGLLFAKDGKRHKINMNEWMGGIERERECNRESERKNATEKNKRKEYTQIRK